MIAGTALFRFDASATIGAGHAMRCLTLAQVMAARGWHVRFAVNEEAMMVVRALCDQVCIMMPPEFAHDASWLGARVKNAVDLLIVDHYALDSAFERDARSFARRVVAIDDLGERRHDVDVLIDATLGGQAADYGELVPEHTLCLMGAHYALLRPAFARKRHYLPVSREFGDRVRVLVSLGATDPGNATALALEALRHVNSPISVTVVLGSVAPHVREIRECLGTLPFPCRVLQDVVEMAELVASHDLVVGASGMSAWERCCLGVASLLLLTAGNQERSARALREAGAAHCPGYASAQSERQLGTLLQDIIRDKDGLRRMGEKALVLCDGLGAFRVASALESQPLSRSGVAIGLRPLALADSAQILEWQRHPDTRRYARQPQPPDLETHDRWIRSRISDPRTISNIILCGEAPAGLVTLQWQGEHHEVSIFVSPAYKRQGLAVAALELVRGLVPDDCLVAEVLEANAASHSLFRKAGYRLSPPRHYVQAPTSSRKEQTW